jgi:hypothetical protein
MQAHGIKPNVLTVGPRMGVMRVGAKVKVTMASDGGCVEGAGDDVMLTFGGLVKVENVEVWTGWGNYNIKREVIGKASSTLAEYMGKVGTLKGYAAWREKEGLRPEEAEATLDSRVVEGQVDGEFRCQEVHLRIGREAVRRLLMQTATRDRHVLREHNEEADRLALKGRTSQKDRELFVSEWDEKMVELKKLMTTMGVKEK